MALSPVDTLDTIIKQACGQGASDIHFESMPVGLKVRFRVDGLLYDHTIVPQSISLQVLARIKVLARVDVAERRIPQDGKFSVTLDNKILDMRVATFPALYGEKIVIRILARSQGHRLVSELGFNDILLKNLTRLINRTTGFFLVTGPTGAGKTTTLYALLSELQVSEKNVVTLEDPIEYNIENVTQGQIQPDIGFTFARGIRSLLRQDPDVIMVGEIRDKETAEVAIQAALTGHMVLSTLHTNDAPSAVIRLLDMGVPAFLINATLTGVLAQRLVRVLCSHCSEESVLDVHQQEFLSHVRMKINKAYQSHGCDACNKRGYRGRTGIFELLPMSPGVRALVSNQPSYDALIKQAAQEGMVSLYADAACKIEAGITTIGELARVIW